MRILFLTFHYPPDPAVGAIRASNAVRALEERGHEVVVIAAGDPEPHRRDVHRIRPHRNAAEVYRGSRPDQSPGGRAGSSAKATKSGKPLPWWKRIALSVLLTPDENQGYILPAVRIGRALARTRFDLLFTTAPPHSVTVSGLLLKRLTGLPWVAELRDPWTDNAVRPPYHTALRARILGFLESRSLRRADGVIAVTGATADRLRERTRDTDKVRLIRNGVPDPTVRPGPAAPAGTRPFRIVHTGTLYGSRDPRPLIAAIAALRAESAIALPESIQLEMVGNCAWYEPLIREAAQQLSPRDRVVFHGSMSQEEAARMMATADLLLLLAQNQPLQVPQKLYDYLAGRRPILAFVDRDGESADMLREVGGHYLVHTEDTGAIRSQLESAVREGTGSFETDEDVIEAWSVRNQMGRLVELVEAIAP